MKCLTCEQDLAPYICDFPESWKKAIIKAVCTIAIGTELSCDDVAYCETLTALSPIVSSEGNISAIFTDENHKEYHLSANVSTLVDASLDEVDPNCLASQEAWDAMTNKERLELIINASCNC